MYVARFTGVRGDFVTAVLRWPTPSGALVPLGWHRVLLAQTGIDFALRVVAAPPAGHVLLFLNADAARAPEVQQCCETLLRMDRPPGLAIPAGAGHFDDLLGQTWPWHMHVTYDGYHHGGEPLACDFRLYPVVTRKFSERPTIYQIHARPYRPDLETERRVRKYIAHLDVERPFTDSIRTLQRLLAQRLLQPGFRTGEFLAAADRDGLDDWHRRISTDFMETTGRIGFSDAPLELGDFSEWLTSGRHPTREAEAGTSIPAEAASVFGDRELALLLSTRTVACNANHQAEDAASGPPQVFISYASGDAAYATAACDQLEEHGLTCWIAPRDIDRDILLYPEAIARAIAHVRVVVVLLSHTANLSVHIPRELDLALARKLPVVPIRLQDVVPQGQLQYLLSTCQWLNAFERNFTEAIDELVTRLRKLAT
jgi:hypothetical protein